MTINAPAVVLLAFYEALAEERGIAPDRLRGHHPERHVQGVHRPEGMDLRAAPAPAHRARHAGPLHARACRAGTPSASAATTSARRARPRCRSWRSPWPTASATSSWGWRPGWTSTSSPRGCRSSGTCTTTSSRRSPSCAPPGGMWARIMRERFGAKNPRSWMLRAHAQTAGVSLVAQQPLNNVVRTTLQALAAVLGGVQSLHTNSFDETYALPTEEAATLALRTQQIIAEEIGHPRGGRSRWAAATSSRPSPTRWRRRPQRYLDRDRRPGRHHPGHRGGLPAAGDRGRCLRPPTRGRCGRASRGRGEQVRDRATSPAIPTLKIDHGPERDQIDRLRALARPRATTPRQRGPGRRCAGPARATRQHHGCRPGRGEA